MLSLLPPLLHYASLPLLFYTAPSSWSTSLNLLFFYLTWTTLLLSHPPLHITVLGTAAVRVLTFLLPTLSLALLDLLLPTLCDRLRFRPGRRVVRKVRKRELHRRERELLRELDQIRARATRRRELPAAVEKVGEVLDGAVEGVREVRERVRTRKPRGLGWRVYAWAAVNAVVVPAVLLAAVEGAVGAAGARGLLRVQRTLPLPAEIAWDMIRSVGLREVMSYAVHRFVLHAEQENWFARQHLRWNHAASRPRAVLACYDHPVNHVLHQTLPALLPAFFVRMHLLTFFLWVAWTGMEQVVAYCGYTVAGVVPVLGGTAARVDCHFDVVGKRGRREKVGRCFSVWGITDWVCGTGEELVEESEGGSSSEEEEEGYKRLLVDRVLVGDARRLYPELRLDDREYDVGDGPEVDGDDPPVEIKARTLRKRIKEKWRNLRRR